MWAKWDKGTRMDGAKKVLTKMVDSLKNVDGLEMALRCYGHQSPVSVHDCKDTKLEVPFHTNNAQEIIDFVKGVTPNGWTPIAYTLTQAAADFPSTPGKNIILLITDGIEECDGDPCEVSQQLQARNIILKPYIIGIGLNDEKMKFFDCVGRYYNPKNEKELNQVFASVVNHALNTTSVQVRLMDVNGQPTETDANMTFYNNKSGKIEHNFYHTMNEAGQPDTFTLDPFIDYNLQVHTLPPVYRNNIHLQGGKHNVIDLPAPRGKLRVSCKNQTVYLGMKCIVYRPGTDVIVNVQDINTIQEYITGNYDVEILTLPRIKIANATIQQSKTNNIMIPDPGKMEIDYKADVIASLYINRNNTQEWVMDLNGYSTQRKDLLLLQPGSYTVIYRPYRSTNTLDSRAKTFSVLSGGFVNVTLE